MENIYQWRVSNLRSIKMLRLSFFIWLFYVSFCFKIDLRCLGTLGMESGAITNGQISFSSQKENDAKIVRLHHTERTWIADENDIYQWLQLDLRAQNTEVTRVATQGYHQHNKWVKKYKLQYSNYGVRFQNYTEQGQTISKVKLIRGLEGF